MLRLYRVFHCQSIPRRWNYLWATRRVTLNIIPNKPVNIQCFAANFGKVIYIYTWLTNADNIRTTNMMLGPSKCFQLFNYYSLSCDYYRCSLYKQSPEPRTLKNTWNNSSFASQSSQELLPFSFKSKLGYFFKYIIVSER